MPCMCGDLYCRSCGPAQGNRYCPACNEWQDEFDQPDSRHDNEKCGAENRAADEAEYQWHLENQRLETEIKKIIGRG